MGDQTPIGEYYLSVTNGEMRLEEVAHEADALDPAFLAYEQDMMAWIDAADDDTRPYVAAVKFNELPDIAALSLSPQSRAVLIETFSTAPDNRYATQALPRLKRAMLGQAEFSDPMAPEVDQAFFVSIKGLQGQEMADAAARFVNKLPDGHAMALMPDTKLHMLKAFQQARRVTPDIRRARFTVHENIDQGDIYEMRTAFREQLADTLARDPVVQRGVEQWTTLNDDARRDVLQHVVDTQNKLAGHPSVKVEVEDTALRETSQGKQRSRGHYQPDGPVRINRSHKSFWDNPAKVIGTTVHEVTHHDQLLLGRGYANGEIARDDPRYLAAAIFNDGVTHGYVSARTDTGHYQNQLVEKLARATQSVVERRLDDLGLEARVGSTQSQSGMAAAVKASDVTRNTATPRVPR